MGLLPCIQLLCEHSEKCQHWCRVGVLAATTSAPAQLCALYISVGSPGICARDPSALQTTQPPDSSGQPRALGLAFPKTSPSVCCSAILETLTAIGNSGRDGAVLCFVGGCRWTLCSLPGQSRAGSKHCCSRVWRTLCSAQQWGGSGVAATLLQHRSLLHEPAWNTGCSWFCCYALPCSEHGLCLCSSSPRHTTVSFWDISPPALVLPLLSTPCVAGGRGWPRCQGRVWGCCCWPCSAPPFLANGAEVSAAFLHPPQQNLRLPGNRVGLCTSHPYLFSAFLVLQSSPSR